MRTVEGEIRRAFEKAGIECGKIMFAGRTDSGVHAIGNVFATDLEEFSEKVVKILNSNLPEDVSVWGYRIVDENFKPRKAKWRKYCYVIVDEGYNLEEMRKAAKHFIGKHDFRFFVKGRESCVREVYESEVERKGNLIYFSIKANAFAWNMVRRMASSLMVAGKEGVEEFLKILNGERIVSAAPPEGLVLVDVHYGFEFEKEEFGLLKLRNQIKKLFFSHGQLFGAFNVFNETFNFF